MADSEVAPIRVMETVPYENLAIMLDRPPSVDPARSLDRIGEIGRAGYCFHHNGAFETVLRDLVGAPGVDRCGTSVTEPFGPGWRRAVLADAVGLRDLEKVANLVGLAHVFPAAEFPFPDAEVLDRWTATLGDPSVTVELVEDPEPVVLLAVDRSGRLRHLAVHPDRWGTGLASSTVQRAVAAIRAFGVTPRLWCLAENHRARGLYERLGWRPTGREQPAEWPPYPIEQEWVLSESAHER